MTTPSAIWPLTLERARRCAVAIAIVHTALLSACGGGGGGDTGSEPDTPAAPTILVEPYDLALQSGQQARLTVTASGSGAAYQWQRSTNGGDWADIAGEARAELSLGPVALEDQSTRYRVVVSNAGGAATSHAARLSVREESKAPRILREPVGASVIAGEAAKFTVQVLGSDASQVRWQSSTDRSRWSDVPNGQGLELVTGALGVSDDGRYFRALASNSEGTVYSDPAWLRVDPTAVAPSLSNTNGPAIPVAEMPAGVRVLSASTYATPSPTMKWQVSADYGKTYIDVVGEANTHASTINRVGSGHGGKSTYSEILVPRSSVRAHQLTFRVIATNSAGSYTSKPVTLAAELGQPIYRQPTDQAWDPGQTEALFEVGVAGDDVAYQWQVSRDAGQNYVDVAGATEASYLHSADDSIDHVRVQVTVEGVTTTSDAAALRTSRWQRTYPSRMTGEDLVSATWLDPLTALALSARGHILRSDDGGLSWRTVSDVADAHLAWGGLAANVRTGGTRTVLSIDHSGVTRRSTDGLHWTTLKRPHSSEESDSFSAATFANPNTAIAVGATVIRSIDDGLTWQSAAISGAAVETLDAVAFNNKDAGLAVGRNGAMLRSIDAGAHWAPVNAGVPDKWLHAVAFASDTVVLAAGSHGTLLRSTDAGVTWTRISDSFQRFPGADFWSISMKDASHGTLADTNGMYQTVDGGLTWTTSIGPGQFLSAAYSPLGALVAVGAHGQASVSPNGSSSWIAVNDAYAGGGTGAAFASPSVGVVVTEAGAILRTSDGGITWSSVLGATDVPLYRAAFADASTGVAVGAGVPWRTTDAGNTWTAGAGGPANLLDVAFATETTGFAASHDGLYRTTDAGATWSLVSGTASTRAVRFGSPTTGLALAGTGSYALRTTDGGATWSPTTIVEGGYFYALAFVDANVVLATGSVEGHGLEMYRSTDGGATWTTVGVTFDPDKIAFAQAGLGLATSKDGRLYSTGDGGLTWTNEYWGESFVTGDIVFADSHTAIAVDRYHTEVKRRAGY
jgi:photosystem II stability/assembly factor-like uncharacterized protein